MANKKPNILVLFTDQQRADTIAALGNPVIKTPSLDRLVKMSIAFTSAFTPSPVCVPARASLHFSQYPAKTKCYDNGFNYPDYNDKSYVSLLSANGYQTHAIGKKHFTPDLYDLRGYESREFQEEIVDTPEKDHYLQYLHKNGFAHICDPHGIRGDMYYIPQPAQMPAIHHPTQWLGNRTVDFIEKNNNGDKPWYLFASFIHPHPPFAPPNPWHKLYYAPDMPLPKIPDNFEDLITYVNKYQNRYKYRDFGIDHNLLRNQKAYYYACISFIDFQVGKILDKLESTGQLDNTMIIYSSDHGEHLGDNYCFGKRSMHNGPSNIPLLVKQPHSLQGNEYCGTPTSLIDVGPTILTAAGIDFSNQDYDGADLISIKNKVVERSSVYSHYQYNELAQYMIVTNQWKYIYSAPDNKEILFDRINDPQETSNKITDVKNKEIIIALRSEIINHLQENNETDCLNGNAWRIFPQKKIPESRDAGLIIQDSPWANQTIKGYTS